MKADRTVLELQINVALESLSSNSSMKSDFFTKKDDTSVTIYPLLMLSFKCVTLLALLCLDRLSRQRPDILLCCFGCAIIASRKPRHPNSVNSDRGTEALQASRLSALETSE